MKKDILKLQKIEVTLNILVMIAFSFGVAVFFVMNLYSDFLTVINGQTVVAEIKNVSKEVSGRNAQYRIKVEYEIDEEKCEGVVFVKKKSDYIGDYFSAKYRTGNKIMVLAGQQNNLILYSQRKIILLKDIVWLLISFALLVICLISIKPLCHVDSKKYALKESICSFCSILCWLCFLCAGGCLIILEDFHFVALFLSIGFALLQFPSAILLKKVYTRYSGDISYAEKPRLFIFELMFDAFIVIMMLICAFI